MRIKEEKKIFKSIQITLEYQEEVDQLYALLNFSPVEDVLAEGTGEWRKLLNFLRNKQLSSNHWHTRFCQMRLRGEGEGK